METTSYYSRNESRRSRTSHNSRGSGREGCSCRCDRDGSKNLVMVISLTLVLGLTAALLVLGLSTQTRFIASEMEKTVESRVRLMWELINNQDFDNLVELFTTDAKLMPPGKPILTGKPAILDHFKTSSKVTLTDCRVEELEIVSDVMAFSVSDFAALAAGNETTRAKSIMIWKKVEGTWLVYRDIYNSS